MLFEIESGLAVALLFGGLILMMELGWRLGRRHRKVLADGGEAGLGAVEAAVYAILGLLVAFTFQGATSRFDERRALIAEEVNAIGTAWQRLDLLPETNRAAAQALFRQYVEVRIETYRRYTDVAARQAAMDRAQQIQDEIWAVATGTRDRTPQAVVTGVLPILNEMFDIVLTRRMAAAMHPPPVVFVMLATLALASALFAGHGMSGASVRSWLHVLGYAVVLSVTVFVIIDIEFPRRGLIRLDAHDQLLLELLQTMQPSGGGGAGAR